MEITQLKWKKISSVKLKGVLDNFDPRGLGLVISEIINLAARSFLEGLLEHLFGVLQRKHCFRGGSVVLENSIDNYHALMRICVSGMTLLSTDYVSVACLLSNKIWWNGYGSKHKINFFFFNGIMDFISFFSISKERNHCSGLLNADIVLQRKLELGFRFSSSWKMLPWN